MFSSIGLSRGEGPYTLRSHVQLEAMSHGQHAAQSVGERSMCSIFVECLLCSCRYCTVLCARADAPEWESRCIVMSIPRTEFAHTVIVISHIFTLHEIILINSYSFTHF